MGSVPVKFTSGNKSARNVRYSQYAVFNSFNACLLYTSQLNIAVPGPIKSVFFLLFLFAVGYKVGPQFFRRLKKDGLPQVGFAVLMCVSVLLVTLSLIHISTSSVLSQKHKYPTMHKRCPASHQSDNGVPNRQPSTRYRP